MSVGPDAGTDLGDDPGRDASAELAELLAADQATHAAAAAADQWLETFRRTARETLSEPELDDLVRAALVAIARMLRADAAALMLANEDGSTLVSRAGYGLAHELELELSIRAGTGLTGPILATGAPRVVDDLSVHVEEGNPLHVAGLRPFVGVALRSGKRILGVVYAARRRLEPFDAHDVEVAELLAGPIAAAVQRVETFRAERAARQAAERALADAERATQRVRSLQRITAALAGASSVGEICELILGEAVRDFTDGLGQGAIWMLREPHLVLVAGSARSADYGEIPLDSSLPAAAILATGEPLFVESQAEMERRWPALVDAGTPSFAGFPLIIDGRRFGLMAVGYREEHTFAPDERGYLAALAEQAATALARSEAETALGEARRLADQRREQLAFLAEASERLGQSLDLEVTLASVAQLSVPRLTDRCALYLLEDHEVTKRALAPNLTPDEWRLFEDSTISLSAPSGVGAVLGTGQPEYVPNVEDAMLVASAESPERLELLRGIGFGGMVILPLRARGHVLGALALVNRAGRPMSEGDRALGEELAARAAVAIDNAQLYGREAHVARRLAESLMPARLPEIGGLDLAARYEPGSRGLDIGGDFYDVSAMGDGAWLVVIGDVQGKGVEAAAVTGIVRHTLRSAALKETSPARLMEHLNTTLVRYVRETAQDAAHPWDSARLCTAALLRLDQRAGGWVATASCAGHPPPLLRRANGSVEAVCTPALMLGIDEGADYGELVVELPAGSCLVLYTDGASDRLETADVPGSAVIAQLLKDTPGTAREITDVIAAAALAREGPHDDLVVLTVRVEGPSDSAAAGGA